MAAKLRALEDEPRFSPEKCLRQMLADMAAGTVKPRRIVIVTDDGEHAELDIRAAGPGMDYAPTAIGLLFLAADDLSMLVRANAEG